MTQEFLKEAEKLNEDLHQKWSFFEGSPDNFNITHECVDRHPPENLAIRIKFDDGRREVFTFRELRRLTSQFAHLLERINIAKGERVAVMLHPSLEFYVSFFGTIKRGAVVLPLSPLFGPEAVAYRLRDAKASAIITTRSMSKAIDPDLVPNIIFAEELLSRIGGEDGYYKPCTSADDPAVIQYSSGTTGVPKCVLYKHKTITVQAPLLVGLRNESYFCPSSPAWGHGIWYGTVGPLIVGTAIGAYSGKFRPETLLEALEEFEVTVLSAAPTVFRMIMNSGKVDQYRLKLKTIMYTGELMEPELARWLLNKFKVPIIGSYGSTELGPLIVSYVTTADDPKLGSLGRPLPGVKVAILDEEGNELPTGTIGQIAVWRKGKWIKAGDAAYVDHDGYFWYKGRADDIIISAGYTIGPEEVENVIAMHPAVSEVGVIGVPDQERGMVIKAIIRLKPGFRVDEGLKEQIKDFVKDRLSKHEYPRIIEFVDELPKTPDGKIKRNELRQREKLQPH